MNRVYDRAGYLDKVRRLRQAIPDVVITSDVIVGFPGETAEEFEDTMTLIDEVRFDALFTFIFSPRSTPAAKMDDPIPKAEKAAHFQRWWSGRTDFRGKARRLHRQDGALLIDGRDDAEYPFTARTPGNRLVRVKGGTADDVGQFREINIIGANKWSLYGELAEK